MKLPHGEKAFVDFAKLVDYCLNFEHPDGRHKARVFQSALGIGIDNAAMLRDALLDAADAGAAFSGIEDEFGTRYSIRFEMKTYAGRATILSAWIIRKDEDFPRLISCYVD